MTHSHIYQLYKKHFDNPRSERNFLSSLGFFATFATVRALAHAAKHHIGPFRNVSAGGTHIHHSAWGILTLIGVGYAWLLDIATGKAGPRWASRITALAYGGGSALTLDELNLWLRFQNDYWKKHGRQNVDAVILFGSFLSLSVVGSGFWRDLLGLESAESET